MRGGGGRPAEQGGTFLSSILYPSIRLLKIRKHTHTKLTYSSKVPPACPSSLPITMLGARTLGGTRSGRPPENCIETRRARSPARCGNSINLSFSNGSLDVLYCTLPPLRAELCLLKHPILANSLYSPSTGRGVELYNTLFPNLRRRDCARLVAFGPRSLAAAVALGCGPRAQCPILMLAATA